MKKHIILLALLLMAIPVFAMSSYPGTYPSKGGDGDQDSNPRLKMKINAWENCSGIFVNVISDGTLGDGEGIPGAYVDVIALPRGNGILLLAEGYTDDFGFFTFNTSNKNFSISASKDGYHPEQIEFAPKGVSCPKPVLTLDILYDCAKKGAMVSVLSDGEPLERANVMVNGNDAGITAPDGSLFVNFTGKSNVSASFGGQSIESEFTPDCPEENKTENRTETAPPVASPQNNKPAPSQPAPSTDLPFIAGLVILVIALIYILTRGGGKQIGPGPMKPKEIGPGPMKKGKYSIGPGPMKGGSGEIGPGPMKPKEIGPGPM
jgi:hypothetical protein